jgi:hypothetical protein
MVECDLRILDGGRDALYSFHGYSNLGWSLRLQSFLLKQIIRRC